MPGATCEAARPAAGNARAAGVTRSVRQPALELSSWALTFTRNVFENTKAHSCSIKSA